MSGIAELLTRLHEHLLTPKQLIEIQETGERGWWKDKIREADERGLDLSEVIQDDAPQGNLDDE